MRVAISVVIVRLTVCLSVCTLPCLPASRPIRRVCSTASNSHRLGNIIVLSRRPVYLPATSGGLRGRSWRRHAPTRNGRAGEFYPDKFQGNGH